MPLRTARESVEEIGREFHLAHTDGHGAGRRRRSPGGWQRRQGEMTGRVVCGFEQATAASGPRKRPRQGAGTASREHRTVVSAGLRERWLSRAGLLLSASWSSDVGLSVLVWCSWLIRLVFAAGDQGVGVLFEEFEQAKTRTRTRRRVGAGPGRGCCATANRSASMLRRFSPAPRTWPRVRLASRERVGDAVSQRINPAVELLAHQPVLVQGRLHGGQVVGDLRGSNEPIQRRAAGW